MFNKSHIMKRAWVIFSETYCYPSVPFKSIGRKCFAWALRQAWAEAKQAVEAADNAADRNQAQLILHNRIAALDFKPFGHNIARERAILQNQISNLAA